MKIFFTLSLCIFFSVFCLQNTAFSATSSTGRALENFTKEQYELIFESNLSGLNTDYSDIFSLSRRAEIFESLENKAKINKVRTQINLSNVSTKITSLEEAIAIIDDDIASALSDVKDISANIVGTKKNIESNERKIEILQKKVAKNRAILLEYLDYIYKKQNTAYLEGEIDNIRSILLNDGDISDLVNDLYFNSLVQVAGEKLIQNHKKYIGELYLEKVRLEKDKHDLAMMRKDLIIVQKNLKESKQAKEDLLEISKGKQEYYEVFLKKQVATEQNLQKAALQQQERLETVKKEILEKYDCEFVDLSKNSVATQRLKKEGGKCYNINRIIYSESELGKDTTPLSTSTKTKNPLEWPVSPYRGITAFFHDPEYKAALGADHNAIDIKVAQGTPIRAPADGYVVYVKNPVDQSYAFVVLKHADGYITVYGHVNEVFVESYDYVEKWEIFAKSGGAYGTAGAGYIGSGAHLHFEVFKDKAYIDPLDALDVSYLDYNSLPAKYQTKYVFDFKNRKGYDYTDINKNVKVFTLKWEDEIERQKYFLDTYAASAFNDWQMWIDESLNGNIDPSLVMCIWLAESSLGTNLTTNYNIWNVGNNDRGDRVGLSTPRAGIASIVKTLNNKYFKDINRLDLLSGAGRIESGLPSCAEAGEYCYATDTKNWHINVTRCLSHMKGYIIEDDYNFRILK